jgi:heparinase II/III-like protein
VDDHWRQFFRSTRAHSTVEIDGKNQSEIFGIFGTGKTAKCEIAGWFTSDRMDFVEASHDGYEMLPSPVIHRRAVLFVKDALSYWIILDHLEGRGEHTLDLMFHLTPEARCQTGESGEVIVHQSEATSTAIRSLNYPADKPTIVVGQTEPHIQGWVARTTGSREQAPVISFKKTASLPQTFITLVHPDCLRDRIVSVRPLPRIASDNHLEFSWELISPDLTDKVYIDQLAVMNRQHEGRLTVSIERSKAGEPIWRETVGPSRNRFVHQ